MPNKEGRYNKSEVLASGLPYYIPASKRWTSTPYDNAVLLTRTRCKLLKMPVMNNGVIRPDGSGEHPVAFHYAASAGKGTEDLTHRYLPLYDRTAVFDAGELSRKILYPNEIMEGE